MPWILGEWSGGMLESIAEVQQVNFSRAIEGNEKELRNDKITFGEVLL